jgi:hypothetical protein
MTHVFHYTDRQGWNAIRSQQIWLFRASQPKDPSRPPGAYFTDIEPTERNLRTLYKRIRVPKAKQEYVFWFVGREGLVQFRGGRGRDKRIFYCPTDYNVPPERQRYEGTTTSVRETFS